MKNQKSSIIYAEINTAIKERAENILDQLDIPCSYAISQFYLQIILHRGIPFSLCLPSEEGMSGGMN